MTSTPFESLAQVATVGTQLTLRTTRGMLEGSLLELADAGVLIDIGDAIEYVGAHEVESFRLQRAVPSGDSANARPSGSVPPPPAVPQHSDGQAKVSAATAEAARPEDVPSVGDKPVGDKPADETAVLETFFREQAAAEPAFVVRPPQFDIPGIDDDDCRTALVRALNRYRYALKVREPGRVAQDVGPLALIAERMSSPELLTLAGRLAGMSGDVQVAQRLFAKSVGMGDPSAAHDLAHILTTNHQWTAAAEFVTEVVATHRLSTDKGQLVDLLLQLRRLIERAGPDARERVIERLVSIRAGRPVDEQVTVHALLRSLDAGDAIAPPAPVPVSETLTTSVAVPTPAPSPATSPGSAQPDEPFSRVNLPGLVTSLQGRTIGRITKVFQSTALVQSNDTAALFLCMIEEVEDGSLRQALQEGTIGHQVEFRPGPRTRSGSRYPLAQELRAIKIRSHPAQPSPTKPKVYKGTSPFWRAKRAEHAGDLDVARSLFQEEIDGNGSQKLSAIKDLAWLMNRMNQPLVALDLLERYDADFQDDRRAVDNMRLHILLKAQDYSGARPVIERLRLSADDRKRIVLDRQEALCLTALGKRREARKILKRLEEKSPRAAADLLDRIESISSEPGEDAANHFAELAMQATYGLGLTDFAVFCLQRSEFTGVDERSRARGYYDEGDFRYVDQLLGKIRGRRPRERASYALTLAAICYREPQAAGDRQLSELLRRYFSLMGEAGLLGNENHDSIRAYTTEAVSLATRDRLPDELALLLATYSPTGEIPEQRGDRLTEIMEEILASREAWDDLARDLPYYGARSDRVLRLLVSCVKPLGDEAVELIENAASLTDVHDERDRLRTELASFERLRHTIGLGADRLEATQATLEELAESTRFHLDRIRTRVMASAAAEAARYSVETDFQQREAAYTRATGLLEQLRTEIEQASTNLSVQSLLPLIGLLNSRLDASFKSFMSEAKPDLVLANVLSDDRQTLEADGSIRIAVALTSKPGGAPVEQVRLIVDSDEGMRVIEAPYISEVVRGGEEREVVIRAQPTAAQIHDQAFTLRCRLSYQARDSQIEETREHLIPVSIDDRDFVEIANPYEPYSGGTIVDDRDMFFGRDELVTRIVRQTTEGPIGQCFVLYGQKRSGKSSVLSQVAQRLEFPFVPLKVTLGILDTTDAQGSFVAICIDAMEVELAERDIEQPQGWPDESSRRAEPVGSLARTLRLFARAMGIGDAGRIVLLVDEFTYIYEYISEGIADPAFMRQWKAMLELRLFSAVVAGQDSMPRFKQEYANEFGVTHDQRISYLEERHAIALATEPILFEDATRHRGRAPERLLRLTAGNPFYLQIMCDEIVTVLNLRKANFITEADVDAAATSLVSGNRMLPMERFDPLITAAGESVALASRDDYLELLCSIAQNSSHMGGARVEQLADVPDRDVLLSDMVDRQVLEREGATRVRIRVGLFEEWLRVNRPADDDT